MIWSSDRSKWILLTGAILILLTLPSCLRDMPESLPSKLQWNPQVALPLGEGGFGLNTESGFDTRLLEEDTLRSQPYWLGLDMVILEGEFDFDLSTISDNLDRLNAILFRVNCSNQFPHTMYSQAYFRDGSGSFLDSMFLDGPVETPAARIAEGGARIDPGEARHDALIEGDRIPVLANAQSILFRSRFYTVNVDTSLIASYPDFHFHIDSGFMLDLSFEE
jgi:hypothetical protein